MTDSSEFELEKKVELPVSQEPPKLADENALLRQALEEEQEKSAEYLKRLKYLQADFENYRKRTGKELEEALRYACEQLIEQLLTVLDSLELALESAKETSDKDSLVKGVEMTLRCLEKILKDEGLVKVDALGKAFDPHLHQAAEQVSTSENPEELEVVEEFRKGYLLKGKLIRPSVVKVGKVEKGENLQLKKED